MKQKKIVRVVYVQNPKTRKYFLEFEGGERVEICEKPVPLRRYRGGFTGNHFANEEVVEQVLRNIDFVIKNLLRTLGYGDIEIVEVPKFK